MSFISDFKLRSTAHHIWDGNVIAYPTEAVYGLGCNPLDEEAVLKLLALKQRPIEKGLILIASDFSQLSGFLDYDEKILARVSATWPGAVTWTIPIQPWVPKWLTGSHQSLAVRVTAHPLVRTLCEHLNSSLVSTSANPSHKNPALNPLQVRKYFANQVFIMTGKTGGYSNTTPIYDAKTGVCFR